MKIFAILLLWAFAMILARGSETNRLYIYDNGHLTGFNYSGEFRRARELVMTAETNPECRPASEFTNGNWGPVSGGFQMSLRLNQLKFTNGEPIAATIIIRNVADTNLYLSYSTLPTNPDDGGPFVFEVISKTGRAIPQRQYHPEVINNPCRQWLIVGTQIKYEERVDRRCDLTNGTYSVKAVTKAEYMPYPTFVNGLPVYRYELQKTVPVRSAPVEIEIGKGL